MLARYDGRRVQGPTYFHGQIALWHHAEDASDFASVGGLSAKVKGLNLRRHFSEYRGGVKGTTNKISNKEEKKN